MMPDLMTALRNADSAGDTAAATRIAGMIKAQKQPVQKEPLEQLRDLTIQRAKLPMSDTSLDEQISGLRQQTGQLDTDTGASQFKPANLDLEAKGVLGTLGQSVKQGAADIGTGYVTMFNELRSALGDDDAKKVIEKVQVANTMRQMETTAQTKEHPVVGFAGEVIGGALALPLPAAQGATKIATVGKSAGLGAIGGATQAAGTGGDIATGAGIGATVGAAIPIIGPKLLKAGKGIATKTASKAIDIGKKTGQKFTEVTDFTKSLLSKEGRDEAAFAAKTAVNKMTGAEKRGLIAEMIRKGDPNTNTVTKMLNESGDLVTNAASKKAKKILGGDVEALKTISTIEAMSGASKRGVNKMLNILSRSREETRFEAMNRVENVVGDAIGVRAKAVVKLNNAAGKKIGDAAKNMKGQTIDISKAKDEFFGEMDKLGVVFNDVDGRLKPDFSQSKWVGGGADKIERIANFIKDGTRDGLEAHTDKQFIRDMVSFGKGTESAISKGSSNILKKLAAGINESLGRNSKAYAKANEEFSKTIDMKNALDKMAGKDIDLFSEQAGSALGDKARRLLSNATSRNQINQTLSETDEVLAGFDIKFKDNIVDLNNVALRLKDIFKVEPPASFLGQTTRAGANVAQGGSPVRETLGAAIDTVKAMSQPDFDKKITALKMLTNRRKNK